MKLKKRRKQKLISPSSNLLTRIHLFFEVERGKIVFHALKINLPTANSSSANAVKVKEAKIVSRNFSR